MLIEFIEIDPKTEDEILFATYEFTPSEETPKFTKELAGYLMRGLDIQLITNFRAKYVIRGEGFEWKLPALWK